MELKELRRLAAENELSLNFIYKDYMISKALQFFQNKKNFILKGGTAINRIYLKENKRFSEDLDFDFIYKGKIKTAITILTANLKGFPKEFKIEKPRIMHNTIRFDAYYINPLNMKDRIMLEFHIIKKAEKHHKQIINYGFVPYDSSLIDMYLLNALIKQKIRCLLTRVEGKDIYDLYYLLDVSNIKIGKKERDRILSALDLDKRAIKLIGNSTNHYIRKRLRPNWQMFIEELKEKIMH